MSKSLPFLLLALLALAPAANAQDVDATSSLAIEGLPSATFQTNETIAVFDFMVAFSISNFVCLGEGATITVALTAGATGDGSANYTAEVAPATMAFTVPPTTGVTGFSQRQGGVLTLRPDEVTALGSNITANLMATVTGITGCQMATVDGPSDEAQVAIQFLPARSQESDVGQELPGPAFPLVLVALVALAVARRRA